MPAIVIPSGTITIPPQAYERTLLEGTLRELCAPGRDFTGIVTITTAETLYLLFLFQGRPYAAGKSIGEKPFALSLQEFCREVSPLSGAETTLSVHATDPVLLKCLLVFIQDDLTAKAPTSLINLDAVLGQIRQEAADALIILELRGLFNFFFFKDGTRGKCYYADAPGVTGQGGPVDEQLLEYAYGNPDVDALIYRNLATRESSDSAMIDLDGMLRMLGEEPPGLAETMTGMTEGELTEGEVLDDLLLEVLEGPQAGQTLAGSIPCVLGRRDSDIVINDPMVSKTHAAIQVINGRLLLFDLNSTNGTSVNGSRIQKHELVQNDLIGLGATRLRVAHLRRPA